MEWDGETIGRLRAFWTEGLSTAEIGRRLGVTKNAVVGKAHRLDLSARPSPIRRQPSADSEPRAAAVRRISGPTLPPLVEARPLPAAGLVAQDRAPADAKSPDRTPAAPAAEPRPAATRPTAVPSAPFRPAPFRSSRTSSCCWPIGEPGTKAFRFCSSDAATGKPYCQEHVLLAYVKVRDRREEAAA